MRRGRSRADPVSSTALYESGLKGIPDRQVLWATDTRFLNDATELPHGIDIFASGLAEYDLTGYKTATQRFALGMSQDRGDVVKKVLLNTMALTVLSSAFVLTVNLLSQWRAHASLGELEKRLELRASLPVQAAAVMGSGSGESWSPVAPGTL